MFLGLLVSTLVVVIDRNLAWRAETDAVGAMRYATTLAQLILGLVVAAVSLAALPQLSYHHANADEPGFSAKLDSGDEADHGLARSGGGRDGGARDADRAAPLRTRPNRPGSVEAHRGGTAALPAGPSAGRVRPGADLFVLRPKNTWIPVAIGILASASYMLVALTLFDRYQMRGLVFANTFQFAVHTLLMFWFGRRLIGRTGISSLWADNRSRRNRQRAMGVIVWAVWRVVATLLDGSRLAELGTVAVPLTVGAVCLSDAGAVLAHR